ncbi:hypothetical protein H0C74_001719 [Salmonella enterica]|uniref:hypothetical protein n=1 Tax=Citrobacter werkmanii TaxID=67827 RepID=UPI001378906F|nr:hypothetical protein [Citrobacter werkmanii]EFQ5086474.1 hypothetical protein [Salmonella enterica]NBD81002.1 hypothetical protein [Citrobacter werkmanii]
MAKTMLYKQGNTITCGQHSLDYIIVADEEVEEKLSLGWVKTPAETELPEPDPEPEVKTKKKPGPKPKAEQNGEDKG